MGRGLVGECGGLWLAQFDDSSVVLVLEFFFAILPVRIVHIGTSVSSHFHTFLHTCLTTMMMCT